MKENVLRVRWLCPGSTPGCYALLLLMLLCVGQEAHAQGTLYWEPTDMRIGFGDGRLEGRNLILSADPQGRAAVIIPMADRRLEDYSQVTIEFGRQQAGVRGLSLIWRYPGQAGVQQFDLPSNSASPLVLPMESVAGWRGEVEMIALAAQLAPGGRLVVRSISIASPGLLTPIVDALVDWTGFEGWGYSDINFYTGTLHHNRVLLPVPIFALVLFFLLAGIVALTRSGRADPGNTWAAAGVALLVTWIVLDAFWQLRLARQSQETWQTFAGKTNSEKLALSDDADFVRLARMVRASMGEGADKRLFLASASDFMAMSTAYYLAPINTYWHRRGPELPSSSQLRPGDHILLVSPTEVRFDQHRGRLLLPDGEVSVAVLARDPLGRLLVVR